MFFVLLLIFNYVSSYSTYHDCFQFYQHGISVLGVNGCQNDVAAKKVNFYCNRIPDKATHPNGYKDGEAYMQEYLEVPTNMPNNYFQFKCMELKNDDQLNPYKNTILYDFTKLDLYSPMFVDELFSPTEEQQYYCATMKKVFDISFKKECTVEGSCENEEEYEYTHWGYSIISRCPQVSITAQYFCYDEEKKEYVEKQAVLKTDSPFQKISLEDCKDLSLGKVQKS